LSGVVWTTTLKRVTGDRTQIQSVLGRRQDWTPIAVQIDDGGDLPNQLLALAEARQWRLVSLGKFSGQVPVDVTVRGALVDVLPTTPMVRQLLDQGIPVVRIGRLPHPEDHHVPAVMHDHLGSGRVAAEHFAQRDFRHVAYVGRKPWSDERAMYQAYAKRCDALGLQCHLFQEEVDRIKAEHATGQDVWQLRREAFVGWLAQAPKPLGLFTFGDPAADLYCQWIVSAGLRVPEDVAVLGMGDNAFVCECATVPISSVAPDRAKIARTAVDMLARLMTSQALDQTTVQVPPLHVVTRQSTDVLAASDPTVMTALRFMWDRVADDLSVDQIARHVGVSRRTLERAFTREMGRGINAEFQRRRLEEARKLLVQTDLKVAEIATAMGCSSRSYFFQAFRKAFGISPAQYRKQHPSAI
jgi:LacI family transcriptional regulator